MELSFLFIHFHLQNAQTFCNWNPGHFMVSHTCCWYLQTPESVFFKEREPTYDPIGYFKFCSTPVNNIISNSQE